MAENKKGFILYADVLHTVQKLDDETTGKLFKHILEYVNDLNPEAENLLVEVAFEPIKQQLKRDLKLWEKKAERARENGSKGGRPKTQKNQVGSLGSKNNPEKPVTVIDTVTVTGTDTVKDIFKKEFEIFLNSCFKYLGKDYVSGNPKTHRIEATIRRWLVDQDPLEQARNIGAYIKVTDKKFRVKKLETLLDRLDEYNFTQDLKSVMTSAPLSSDKTPQEIQDEISQIQRAYKRQKEELSVCPECQEVTCECKPNENQAK